MKKFSILLFAIMMAGDLSAQIDSFDDSDNFVTGTKPSFNKLPYLSPYKGGLSVYDDHKWDSVLKQWGTINNIIGEQVFYLGDNYNKSENLVATREGDVFVLSKIQPSTYYTIKDILITQEEIDSLRGELVHLGFKSDTLYYEESGFLKKNIKYTAIPQNDVLNRLCHNLFQPENRFRGAEERYDDMRVDFWMYILKDSNDVEYYIPNIYPNPTNHPDLANKFYYGGMSYSSRGYRYTPEMKNDFIVVNGFLLLKQKFENQRVCFVYDRGDEGGIKLCKKIAFKDRKIMAAITDTLSTSVSYAQIRDFGKGSLGRYSRKDSLFYMRLDNDGYSDIYYTLHDIDSLKAKNAYEEHLAEIEKAKKDEKRKQELIRKYGQKYGTSIFNKEACVGMTKAMCKEAIGSPDQVTKSQTSSGNVEVWSYTLAYQMWNGLAPIIVVTFTNDKVTAVDKYTSWPF